MTKRNERPTTASNTTPVPLRFTGEVEAAAFGRSNRTT
jgi:hypothetical protein